MKKNKKYVIEQVQYYNHQGQPSFKYYEIKYLVSFLFFWKKWKYVKMWEPASHGSMGYYTRASFDEIAFADNYIENVLCKDIPIDREVRSFVKTCNC